MKKNAFTLIELLAVIIILSIIFLIAVPFIAKVINTAKEKSNEESVKLYGHALENAVSDYYVNHPETMEISLEQIKEEKLLKYNGSRIDCDIVQISKKKVYLSSCKVNDKEVDYTYGKYDPAPELDNGLVPIEYKNNKWVVANKYSSTWYNYDKQKWANAVILNPGIIKTEGETLDVELDVAMMFVWIPRYEYKIEGQYGKGGTQKLPGEIEINFIPKNITESKDSNYIVHPAFKFGDEQLNGFWVAKFELSNSSEINYAKLSENNRSLNELKIDTLKVLPNQEESKYRYLSDYIEAIMNIKNIKEFGLNGVDTHVIKNSEWGAVAYLSQSKYGKYGNNDYEGANKEVFNNNSYLYKTGISLEDPEDSDSVCEYDNFKNLGVDLNGYKMGQCGPRTSTTGNIYGVYDMSGGAWEYVMGVYSETDVDLINISNLENKEPDISLELEKKYFDLYTSSDLSNGSYYGHALSETAGWYSDKKVDSISLDNPFIRRGGWVGESFGIFSYGVSSIQYGISSYYPVSTRVIINKK